MLDNMILNIQIDENFRQLNLKKYGIFPIANFQPPPVDLSKWKELWITLFYFLNILTFFSVCIIVVIIILFINFIIRASK